MDPTIYLLAFGFGFGSLVSKVAGYNYIDFVGTGIVATTVLFSGVQLVRHVVFGRESFADVGHLAFLTVFAVVSWRLAIRFLERKLIL